MNFATYLSRGMLLGALVCAAATAAASDYWTAATEPGVVTNNDCGQIAHIYGSPLIRRSFHAAEDAGIEANIADRISSGDELFAPAGSRVEIVAGSNTVLVLGTGARIRLDGLRTFSVGGTEAARLDVTLLAGEIRVQVRRNESKPEAVLVGMGGAEIVVTRGDVEMFADGGWRCSVLDGSAAGRMRRGGMPGAPFPIAANTVLAGSGSSALTPREKIEVKARVPFSFELTAAALPPLPPLSAESEAP